jgi:hypothetical protein
VISGVVVRLVGLVGAAEHNGKLAAVRRHLPAKARFELELLDSCQRMDVRPENFALERLPYGTQVLTTGSVAGFALRWPECGWRMAVAKAYTEPPSIYTKFDSYEPPKVLCRSTGGKLPKEYINCMVLFLPKNLALVPVTVPPLPRMCAGALASGMAFAARTRDVGMLRRLLAAGADPNAASKAAPVKAADGRGPTARSHEAWEITMRPGEPTTPLWEAVEVGHEETVEILLAVGADPSLPRGTGETPLMIATATAGRLEVFRLLLESGAAVDAVTLGRRLPFLSGPARGV